VKRLFAESRNFTRLVADGRISDRSVKRVQVDIMNGLGDTIAGTGGLKKIRCASEGRGKSGSWRIIFADYPKYAVTFFITAFPKNEKENLNDEEKKILLTLKRSLDREVELKYGQTK
jgi:hypothetical protein